jgi:dual specificity tyrosine-phosphorylation-regulated kinase 2/3/4
MEKSLRKNYSIAKSIKQLSIEFATSRVSKIKHKKTVPSINTLQSLPQHFSPSKPNKIVKSSIIASVKPEIRKIDVQAIGKIKRNRSLENIYDDVEQDGNTLQRNSSLLGKQSKTNTWDDSKVPYPPGIVIKKFASHLTVYEQSEILGFRNIYYAAIGVCKLQPNQKRPNFGYDDDRNDLLLVKHDHIAYRYEILEILGRGSYGQVIKAVDHKDKTLTAVKIIRNVACITQQAKVEIQVLYKLLQASQNCDYIIQIKDNSVFRNHIIETFELLDITLYQYINNKSIGPLPIATIKLFATQILEAMKFYHSLNILHCDIKPENIMLSTDRSKAITIDFGSACFANRRIFTYIQSRYYRAPEVILELGYDCKIDIWSFGCVLAELLTGQPLFPGRDEVDQFLAIAEYLGLPPPFMINGSPKAAVLINKISKMSPNAKNKAPGTKTLAQIVPENEGIFLDFLRSKE